MAEMTREQAIENLEYLIKYLPTKDVYAEETLNLAIAALRGGRDTTTTSCYSKKLYCDTCGERIIGKKHNYCPMCGRKLEVEG